jgi:N-formylglutamate amidohydrolase
VAAAVSGVAATSPFPSVLNGRFKGGYITRHYGDPAQRVDAVQLEIAQRAYMDEDTGDMDTSKASILQGTLALMLDAFMESAAKSSR